MLLKPQNISQTLLFSSLDDLIFPEHPIRIVNALIDSVLEKSIEQYKVRGNAQVGRPAYSVNTLIKIFIYGYINRILSSRRLEQETYRNIELMWLIGNLHPDHKTISDFRKDNKDTIKQFSKDIKLFIKQHLLNEHPTISVDGTKLKANASKDMLSQKAIIERLKEAESEIERYINNVDTQDKLESKNPSGEPAESHDERIIELEEEIASLHAQIEKMKRLGKKYLSRTDPDCRMLKSRDGAIPGYNVQFGCETEHHFIMYDAVVDAANDIDQLKPAVEALNEELAIIPEQILADTGYCNLDVIQNIEEETGIQCYIPLPKEQIKSPSITFTYDEENDCYKCSQGQVLTLRAKHKKAKEL
jgi:transposase